MRPSQNENVRQGLNVGRFREINLRRLAEEPFLSIFLTVLILYPPLYVLYFFDLKAVFGFFENDTFYYLTVAKNSTFGFFTYDGELRTNGFHPLWQFLLTLIVRLVGNDQSTQLYATFLFGCLLVTGGLVFVARSIRLVTQSKLAGLWFVPGVFYILFRIDTAKPSVTSIPGLFSCWQFMNGMESTLSIFFGGMLIYVLSVKYASRPQASISGGGIREPESWSTGFLLVLGAVLMCVIMSRLDDIFLLPPLLLLWPYLGQNVKAKVASLGLLIAPTVAVLSGLFLFHYMTDQSLVPVSGSLKSGFCLATNMLHLVQDIIPPLFDISPKTPGAFGMSNWIGTASRDIAMAVPVVLVACFMLLKGEANARAWNPSSPYYVFMPLLAYVILKAAYNFVYVYMWHQGVWYYAVSILIANWLLIVVAWNFRPGMLAAHPGSRAFVAAVWLTVYVTSSGNLIHRTTGDIWNYDFWHSREKIRADLIAIDPQMKLIDRHDGIISYALGLPAVALSGFVVDSEGYRAIRRNTYLDYCIARGFDVMAGAPGYGVDLTNHEAKLIYRHSDTGLTVWKVARKPSSPVSKPRQPE